MDCLSQLLDQVFHILIQCRLRAALGLNSCLRLDRIGYSLPCSSVSSGNCNAVRFINSPLKDTLGLHL